MPTNGSAVPNRFRNSLELPKTGSTVPRPSGGTGTDGRFSETLCLGCQGPVLLGRVFCRQRCRARYEYLRRPQRPLFAAALTLESEWL
jgi:hypothetical protein